MSIKEELEALAARYAQLEKAQEKVEDLLYYIDEADGYLPSGIYGSHHSSMEWSDTLSQIEGEMDSIGAKL